MKSVQMKEEHIVVEFTSVAQLERLSFGENEQRSVGVQ